MAPGIISNEMKAVDVTFELVDNLYSKVALVCQQCVPQIGQVICPSE